MKQLCSGRLNRQKKSLSISYRKTTFYQDEVLKHDTVHKTTQTIKLIHKTISSHQQFALHRQKRNTNDSFRLLQQLLNWKIWNTIERHLEVHLCVLRTINSSRAEPKKCNNLSQLIYRAEYIPLGQKLASSCVQEHSVGLVS